MILHVLATTNWHWFYAINIIYLVKGNFITVLRNIANILESFQENFSYLQFLAK